MPVCTTYTLYVTICMYTLYVTVCMYILYVTVHIYYTLYVTVCMYILYVTVHIYYTLYVTVCMYTLYVSVCMYTLYVTVCTTHCMYYSTQPKHHVQAQGRPSDRGGCLWVHTASTVGKSSLNSWHQNTTSHRGCEAQVKRSKSNWLCNTSEWALHSIDFSCQTTVPT
jgi:hypothetical protein